MSRMMTTRDRSVTVPGLAGWGGMTGDAYEADKSRLFCQSSWTPSPFNLPAALSRVAEAFVLSQRVL
jgi:hypothetical protein